MFVEQETQPIIEEDDDLHLFDDELTDEDFGFFDFDDEE